MSMLIKISTAFSYLFLRHPPYGRTAQERTSALHCPEVPHSPLPAVETRAELRLNVKPKTPKIKKKSPAAGFFLISSALASAERLSVSYNKKKIKKWKKKSNSMQVI